MKILYAIQGTGNGHVSRAREIIPYLSKMGELDILISGTQADISLGYPVKYQFHGMGFTFGKKGGIDFWETLKSSKFLRFIKDSIKLPIHDYDVILNDFEPITSLACRLANKFSIGISHQVGVMAKNAPKPKKKDFLGTLVLKHYAKASVNYGFHFDTFDTNTFKPIIRKEIRDLEIQNKGHYTVYLPAYSDLSIYQALSHFPQTKWEVFSKHAKLAHSSDNIHFFPVENTAFIKSMATSEGVLCGAGFETPAEALFLNKKLLVIPMKNQYEQHCNATSLEHIGVGKLKKLSQENPCIETIKEWIKSSKKIEVNYPDSTQTILEKIIDSHYEIEHQTNIEPIISATTQ